MYTNAIRVVVSIKSPTDRVSKPVSSPVRGHPQRNPLPVGSPIRDRQQHNPLPVSSKDNLNQAKATGQCNSHTKTGARELRTITGHSSNEAAVRADQAAPVDPVVAAEAAAEEGNINRLI